MRCQIKKNISNVTNNIPRNEYRHTCWDQGNVTVFGDNTVRFCYRPVSLSEFEYYNTQITNFNK